ncbi:hypothetical protein MPY17_34075 [Rhodococcus opacus]|uniref:hypothetical protein n=1 Tax=Rhodococcus opacus TaxID=37919 RepID=UPI001FF0F320|nr:hypothetical protein [Rhodococcus opacus]UOT03867.1 hypothetical protein MPY17_34075 [Rhodococcus opacus]
MSAEETAAFVAEVKPDNRTQRRLQRFAISLVKPPIASVLILCATCQPSARPVMLPQRLPAFATTARPRPGVPSGRASPAETDQSVDGELLTNAAILSASLVTLWVLFHIGCSAFRMGTA